MRPDALVRARHGVGRCGGLRPVRLHDGGDGFGQSWLQRRMNCAIFFPSTPGNPH
jgi:hypothetical protein